MGRIKTKLVKRMTNDIIERFPEEVRADFNENKEFVERHLDTQSKKLRNIIAGYATRRKRKLAIAQ
ncbi:MAG TPA: 30S ribosomal protein S17e [Candidatus Nanoarchaeia archaeon]|nr:30S ribosomal protein S17e [Candidatus Nanoarchaeia archaeon]